MTDRRAAAIRSPDRTFVDFNNDGRDDIIKRDTTGTVWVYPHTGQVGTGMISTRTQVGSGWGNCRMGAVGRATITNAHHTPAPAPALRSRS